jgi:tRNA-specific 2-thiouridylase
MVKKNKEKVLLGMSGGVDSSVAGYILKKQGYEVIGANMLLWNSEVDSDAKGSAKKLGIPFHSFNMQEQFKKYVVEYFISEYKAGRTPNPCVICNRYIKFGALYEKAKELGIEYIATGHYARVEIRKDRYLLKKAKDSTKDQTYFLYTLNQEQLSHTVFPLGEYKKNQIRRIAKRLDLDVSTKPDSQDVCFVKNNNHYEFIKTHSTETEQNGEIIDTDGNILGHHNGISKYTIGQRRGLGVVTGKPMFVVDIDSHSNRVVLGPKEKLFSKELLADSLNWIPFEKLDSNIKAKAKIRYQAKEAKCVITPFGKEKVKVVFHTPQRAITRGQSVVFYIKDTVLGGGIIADS